VSASGDGEDAAKRAAWLLRWYPRAWRDRYGEEFTELLISDIAERPRSAARALDVARGGIVARLADAGLCGFPVTGQGGQPASSLASLSACLAVFVIVGAALWSQLTVGWQWSAPASTATMAGMAAMSIAVLVLAVLVILAALPVGCAVTGRLMTGRDRRDLLVPSLVFALCLAAMFIGGRHFGNGWPGTGGRPWAGLRIGGHEWIGRGLVPGGLAAFSWAATLSVTTYWLHPAALAAFPAPEVAWMVASPLFLGGEIWAAAMLVRRAALSPRVLAFEARLAGVACAAMVVFFAGCGCWIVSGGRGLFHAGTIDVAGTCVLALVLAVAGRAAGRAGVRPAWSADLG
jgi:hypothetical protein